MNIGKYILILIDYNILDNNPNEKMKLSPKIKKRENNDTR
jgi:hypothetical protein